MNLRDTWLLTEWGQCAFACSRLRDGEWKQPRSVFDLIWELTSQGLVKSRKALAPFVLTAKGKRLARLARGGSR